MAKVVFPPSYQITKGDATKLKIFLAGSIEMGKAEDWQTQVSNLLADQEDIIIFNPRRDDWDSSWVQSIHDDQFYAQVNWELDHIENANVVLMYFDPTSQSPISLLELGILTAYPDKVLVCCPEGFWRKGNVDIVCERFNIETVETKEEFLQYIIDQFIP
jgi:hypothetical protein